MDTNKRVAFFIYTYPFGTSPAIINTIKELTRNNFAVDVFTFKVSNTQYVKFSEGNVNLYNFDDAGINGLRQRTKSFLAKHEIINKVVYSMLRKMRPLMSFTKKYLYEKNLEKFLPATVKMEITNVMKNRKYICFFGIDAFGLVFANCFEEAKNIPVIYYSLELYLADSYNLYSHRLDFNIMKKYESRFHKKSIFTIIQDEERSRLLNDENKVNEIKTIYLPVSVLGEKVSEKTDYFRKLFNIPDSKHILLVLSQIVPEKLSLEIAEGAQQLSDNFVLIFHGAGEKEYIDKIKKIDKNNKIYISEKLVDFNKIPEIVASADIGIVGFSNVSKNFMFAGSACGGLAYYFQCGLPAIAVGFQNISKIFNEFDCGVEIPTPDKLNDAVIQIMNKYIRYRKNAFVCYEQKYEFSRPFKKVVNEIRNVDKVQR